MNIINPLKLNNSYTQTVNTPPIRPASNTSSQNQTQLCTTQASKAVSQQMKVLIDLNHKEKFVDKNVTVSQVQRNLKALYEISEFLKNTPSLNQFNLTYKDLCDNYFDGLKSRYDVPINFEDRKESLIKFAKLSEQSKNPELLKKIGTETLENIIYFQLDAVSSFDEKTFDVYNRLFNDDIFKPFVEKLSSKKIVSSLFQGEDTDTINKNLDVLKKSLQNEKYAFIKNINPDFDILKYKGDISKFFEILKTYNEKLQQNQKLNFIIDPETNEAVISVTEELDTEFLLRKRDIYDINLKRISEDSTVYSRNKNNILVQNTRVEDFKNNTTYHIRQYCDDQKPSNNSHEKKKTWLLDRQIKEVKDSQGNVINREIIKESGVDGALNIKTIDKNGKIRTTSKAYKNSDGSIYIEKNLKSPDGFVTRIRYKNRTGKDGAQNAEIMDYTVYDTEGKEIAKRENILQKINNLCNASYKNGEKHRIYYTSRDEIKVLNETTGRVVKLNLNELVKDGDKELKEFFKTLSGSTLETLHDTITAVVKTESFDSHCIPEAGYLETAADRFILEHEKGHIKSYRFGNVSQNSKTPFAASLLNGHKGRLSTDKVLLEIYNEEKRMFAASVPRRVRAFAQYYNDSSHLLNHGGIEEVFSDVEAMLNNTTVPMEIIKRVHLLQENFPKTVAYIMKQKI